MRFEDFEHLRYISLFKNPSAPCGTTAAQAWCAQTAEATGLGAGREWNNLVVSENGQIPLLRSRFVYLLVWIKLSLRGDMWLPSLRSCVPAALIRGHDSDGKKPDRLGIVRCYSSWDVFAGWLAFVPTSPLPFTMLLPRRRWCHSVLLGSGMWPWMPQPCCPVPHSSGMPVIQDLAENSILFIYF